MTNVYYVNRVKKRLKDAIESGMLKPEQQFGMIESTIDDLLSVGGINEEAIKLFEDEIDELTKEIGVLQVKVADCYKRTYDKILDL